MNLNDFVVLNKPRSVKLNTRNLRELRMETMQLDQESKEIEIRLQQLRETMSHEKEEREKCGVFRWKSAQSHGGARNKEMPFSKNANSKMKIKVLKDEPLPVDRIPEPPPKDGRSRKSRLKGKVCGQCEARTAGLVCTECGEDYCVGCFARFHQKGALKFHHMVPIQAELHTSISSVDVLRRFQKKHEKADEKTSDWLNPSAGRRTDHNQTHSTQVLLVNDSEEMKEEEEGEGREDEDDEGSLLRGQFNEEESSRSFQQALMQWRAADTHTERKHPSDCMVQTAAVSVGAMGTRADGDLAPPIHIEFQDPGLSYMERLLLKKHRRTPLESYQLLSTPTLHPITPPSEQSLELTAQEMDLHRYCISLFAISGSAGPEEQNNLPKSWPSTTEMDEVAGDSLVKACSQFKRKDSKKKLNTGEVKPPGSSGDQILNPDLHREHPLRLREIPNPRASSPEAKYSDSLDCDSSLSISPEDQDTDDQTKPIDSSRISLRRSQVSQSSRFGDALRPPMSEGSPPKAMSILNSPLPPPPQSHSPLLSTSVQILSPAFPVFSSLELNPDLHQTHTPRLCDTLEPQIPRTSSPKVKYSDSLDWDSSLSISQEGQDTDDQTKPIDSSKGSLRQSQVSQSSRFGDAFNLLMSEGSLPKARNTLNSASPQSHNQLLSTSVQIQSPAFPVFSSSELNPDLHLEHKSRLNDSMGPQIPRTSSPEAKYSDSLDWDSSLSITQEDQDTNDQTKPINSSRRSLTQSQVSQSSRFGDALRPPMSEGSSPKAMSILNSSPPPQSHSPLLSTSVQIQSPAFPVSSSPELNPDLHQTHTPRPNDISNPQIPRTSSPKTKYTDSLDWDSSLSVSQEDQDNDNQIKPIDSSRRSPRQSQVSQSSRFGDVLKPPVSDGSPPKARSILNSHSPCPPQSRSPSLSTSFQIQPPASPVSSSPELSMTPPETHDPGSTLSLLSRFPQTEEETTLDASHQISRSQTPQQMLNPALNQKHISRVNYIPNPSSPEAKYTDSLDWDSSLSIFQEEQDNDDHIKPMDSFQQSLTPSQISQSSKFVDVLKPQTPGRSGPKASSTLKTSPRPIPQSCSLVPPVFQSCTSADWTLQTNPKALKSPLQTPRSSVPPHADSTPTYPEATQDWFSSHPLSKAEHLGFATNPSRLADEATISQSPKVSDVLELQTPGWDSTPTPSSQSHSSLLPTSCQSPALPLERSSKAPHSPSRSFLLKSLSLSPACQLNSLEPHKSTEEASPEDQDLQKSPLSPDLSLSDSDLSREEDGAVLMPSDDEDSSDEEMRRTVQEVEEDEDRRTSSFPPSHHPAVEVPPEQSGLFTEPSPALSSLALRHSSVSTLYKGLDGFLTLGLNTSSVPPSPDLSHTPTETHMHSTHTGSVMRGEGSWRPDSSLRHHTEAEPVTASRSATPVCAVAPPCRPDRSGPVTPDVSRPLTATRPVSRAALQILEAQTVERVDLRLSEADEEEEDQLALASLEQELRQIRSHDHTELEEWNGL